MTDEPLLIVGDIQGHVATGFGRAYELLLGLRFAKDRVEKARAALSALSRDVTSAGPTVALKALRRAALTEGREPPTLPGVALAMSFSARGLAALGADPAQVPDPFFVAGAAADAAALGDEVDALGRPLNWRFGGSPETDIDVLLVIASGERGQVEAAADTIMASFSGAAFAIYRECGARIARDAEHFGFADGISQPGVRGVTPAGELLTGRTYPADHALAANWAKPGQRLTWPGQFIFGYAGLNPDNIYVPGDVAGGESDFLRNGSLLVLRRLKQDVGGFWAAMDDLAGQMTAATGTAWRAEQAAARCVGRWRDGTPVSVSPDGEDTAVSDDPYRRNGFHYVRPLAAVELHDDKGPHPFPGAPADPLALACPFFGHVRKVNPRDHGHDFGGVGGSLRSQMLRRGIPFGPDWPGHEDGEDRGLLFLSYQSSIQSQFRKLMTEWVKDPIQPLGGGIDPLIGPPPPGGRELKLQLDGRDVTLNLPGRFVHATGAAYLFAPGLKALRRLLGA